jgi:hypothetical protein
MPNFRQAPGRHVQLTKTESVQSLVRDVEFVYRLVLYHVMYSKLDIVRNCTSKATHLIPRCQRPLTPQGTFAAAVQRDPLNATMNMLCLLISCT